MECNKEEAVRAKGLAEKKMQARDFVGAQKIVLMAQRLFPDLENISQMLTVCEVHCSAAVKVNGEMDWYSILKVEPTADDITIKKQYRKFALLLHPDKNKFAGAEAAFKLVGEANRILSDQGKRSVYNMKRTGSFRPAPLKQPTNQPNRSSGTRKQGVSKNATSTSSTQFNASNQQQPSQPYGANSFWTMCPFCGIKYQYFLNILNKPLKCRNCMRPFIAYNLNAQAVPSGANPCFLRNPTGIPKPDVRGPGAHVAGHKNYFGNSAHMGFHGFSWQFGSKSGFSTQAGDGTKNKATENHKMDHDVRTGNAVESERVRVEELNKREHVVKLSAENSKQKSGKKPTVESNDPKSSRSDVVIEEDGLLADQNVGSNKRRSTRQKQHISYNEDGQDNVDDFASPSAKRSRNGLARYSDDRNDNASFKGYPSKTDRRSSGDSKLKADEEGLVKDHELKAGEESLVKDRKLKAGEESLVNGLQEREQGTGVGEEHLNSSSDSKANSCVDSSQKTSGDVDVATYPDPEFFDFEKERDAATFKVDQIWAVYDDLDGMPRYYAQIKNVRVPDFKVQFTWLESDPIGIAEKKWCKEDLPISCGNFKLGKVDSTKEVRMFSHLMSWRKGSKRNSYNIHPRNGEVWALFKDWDYEWCIDADSHRVYEYELVEVISDYTGCGGISVVSLVKINGFVSLFMRAIDEGPLEIPPAEILRFSHRVPSYRMTGEEREGIPAGSFELDAVSLPINLENFRSVSLESSKVKVCNLDTVSDGLSFKASGEKPTTAPTKTRSCQLNDESDSEKQKSINPSPTHFVSESSNHVDIDTMASEHQVCTDTETGVSQEHNTDKTTEQNHASPVSSPNNIYEYREAEFSDFEEARSWDKFRCGQIWALYSDESSYPNYYGQITKVDSEEFKLHLTWLYAYTSRKVEKRYVEKFLASCGTFKIKDETSTFDTTDSFSHLVHPVPAERKDHFLIYPNIGEVWAIYTDWSLNWSPSDLKKWKYYVVEILSRSDSGIKVLYLKKVLGYGFVFMPGRQGPGSWIVDIPVADYLSFSHQIPASRLTEENDGKLRGYWELDPASVPENLVDVDSV